jgi:hypothetical protein
MTEEELVAELRRLLTRAADVSNNLCSKGWDVYPRINWVSGNRFEGEAEVKRIMKL